MGLDRRASSAAAQAEPIPQREQVASQASNPLLALLGQHRSPTAEGEAVHIKMACISSFMLQQISSFQVVLQFDRKMYGLLCTLQLKQGMLLSMGVLACKCAICVSHAPFKEQ